MSTNEFHEVASSFPLMIGRPFDELVADITEHGQRESILLYEGKILDGRNRSRACTAAGVKPRFAERQFSGSMTEAIDYVRSENLHRRHLTTGQRAMVAAKNMGLYEKAAKKEMSEGGKKGGEKAGRSRPSNRGEVNWPHPYRTPQSREKVGKVFGVSGASVKRCLRVLKSGIPGFAEAIERNELSVGASEELLTAYTKPKITRLLETGMKAVRAAVAKVRKQGPVSPGIRKRTIPTLIPSILRDIDGLIARVQKSEKGTAGQRKRLVDELRLCRKRVNSSSDFLT